MCKRSSIVWNGKLRRKTTVYCLRTKVISKLMLFIKLTGGPFLQGQFCKFAEFWVFRTYMDFRTASVGVCWTSQVCVVTRDGSNEAEGFCKLCALTSKRHRFILAYNSQLKFDRTFGTRLHELRYKISEWDWHIRLNLKAVSDLFRWIDYFCSVLHVSW